jgi:hypothetical protein
VSKTCALLCLAALWLCSGVVHAQQNTRGQASAQARGEKRDKPARKSKRARAERKRAQAALPDAPAANAPKAEQAVPAPAAEAKPAREATPDNANEHEGAQRPTQESGAPTASPAGREGRVPLSETSAADVRKEGDTEVKVMEFSGLDIEGQLKTPQMLYFLNRLRAEFGRPRLPHRSFMPELQAGTQDKAMR